MTVPDETSRNFQETSRNFQETPGMTIDPTSRGGKPDGKWDRPARCFKFTI